MKLFRLFVGLMATFGSYIIPKKTGLYIFGSIDGKSFSGNSKALFLYLKKNNKNLQLYYVSKNPLIKIENKIYPKGFKYFILFLQAEYIFIDSSIENIFPGEILFGNFNIINLWHGDPIKKMWYGETLISKLVRNKIVRSLFTPLTKISTTSSLSSQKILNNNFGNSSFEITGLTRNDVFFDSSLEFYDVYNYFNLKKYSKIILYTPTWRTQEIQKPFSQEGLKQLQILLAKENILFIFKGHFAGSDDIELSYKNIVNASQQIDIQEIMKYSDILITDYSSIYVDFLLTQRPILFYTYDYDFYLTNNDFSYDYDEVTLPMTQVKSEIELIKLIKNISQISKSKQYIEQYKKIHNLFHKYSNGGYCERVLNKVNKLKK